MNTDKSNNEPAQPTNTDNGMMESSQEEKAKSPPKIKTQGHGVFSGLVIVALALGIIAVSVSGFLWYSLAVTNRLEIAETVARAELIAEEFGLLRSTQQDLITEQTKLIRTIDENRKVIEEKLRVLDQDTRTSLLKQNKEKSDLKDQFKVEIDLLARSMESAHQELDRGTNEWLLEEILQLINLANERLLLVGDLPLAMRALEIAEERIADLSDPALLAVRRQLVADIAMLSNISAPDINGVVLHLSMLMQRVSVLPLSGEKALNLLSEANVERQAMVEDSGDMIEVENTLSEARNTFIEDLRALVRIRNVEKTQAPKLAPELRFHIYESVRTPLNVAQLALLRRLPEVYHTSLDHAKVALMDGFDKEAREVAEVMSAIDRLGTIEVRNIYPDISQASEMLRDIARRRSGGD